MSKLDYRVVWQRADDALRNAVVSFWRAHGAIADEATARARAEQLVAIACARDGRREPDIAGVCTAVRRTIPDLHQPLFYYRTFVAPSFRNGRVALRLAREAVAELERFSLQQPDRGASGIYLELENPVFRRHGRQPVWPLRGLEFVYIGQTSAGHERRVLWFRHARV